MAETNVSRWLFAASELNDTPSHRDGLTSEQVSEKRNAGGVLLIRLGERLRLRIETIATACILFQRFYMYQSFAEFDPRTMAQSCLFAASKCEDKHARDNKRRIYKVRIRHVIVETNTLLFPDTSAPAEDSPEHDAIQSDILACERILLPTLGFDLQVCVPHKYLVLIGAKKRPEMFKKALVITNTLLTTDIFLRFDVPLIACATILHASERTKDEKEHWPPSVDVWRVFKDSLELSAKRERVDKVKNEIQNLITKANELYQTSKQRREGGESKGNGQGATLAVPGVQRSRSSSRSPHAGPSQGKSGDKPDNASKGPSAGDKRPSPESAHDPQKRPHTTA